VKVTVTSRRGKRAVLAILRQADFFGERCPVRRSLWMSTATAIHQSTIDRVQRKTIVRIMRQEPAFAKLVISYLLSRIVRIEKNFVDQILHSGEKRLARDSFAAGPRWKAVRVEVRGAEGEPTNSRGDGRYDALASELLRERL
jgi:CRP-like cAMP-binding protein